ncbi:TonB-dependent receptor [Sphingosinicella terrae]|uniref:TonB-dependent receptor n=1 Tax=Sphingosinicella terrae TaxID=2172047 RepID=UPI002546B76A|nr:TonB-dependent receptor [Sphingosinicella terrae]
MLGAAAPAWSQDPAQAPQAAADEDQEIVVTARYREERLQDVPIAVTAFGEQQIRDARIDQVGDFIGLTPNVTIAQSESSGLSAISIRGITQVRNSEAPVAVVVDGVLQNNPRQFAQELFDVERIEVLRGPQGALYGRNATGGAIIVTTRQPTNAFEGHVRAAYGTGDEYLLEGSASGALVADRLLFRIGARYVDREGYFDNIFVGDEQDPYRDFSASALLRWLPTDTVTIDLRGSLSRTRGGALAFWYQPANLAADGVSLDPANPFDFTRGDADEVRRTFYSTNIGRDDREIEDLSLKVDWELGFATLTSISAYNRLEEFVAGDQVPYTASRNIFGLDGTQTQYIDIEAFSQELRLTSSAPGPLRWMVGAYYLDADRFISSTTGFDSGTGIARVERAPRPATADNPTLSFFGDDNRNRNYAVFGNLAYDILPQLEASLALRYDKEKRRQDVSPFNTGGTPGGVNRAEFDKWQPRASLSYRPTDDVNLYVTYGEGFRSGQFNQNGTAAAAAAVGIAGVSDLVPQENTRTWEVGTKLQFARRRVRIDAAAFDTEVTNQQYFVFIGAIGAQVLVPIDRVRLRGFEALATAEIAGGLSAYAGFGYTDSEIRRYRVTPADVGNRAPYVPETTINLGLQYRTQLTDGLGLFARADYRRLGRQFWDPENTTARSNVSLADFRLGLEDPDGRWTLTGSVENAFDEVYNSEYVLGGFAHAAPPRVWRIDLRYNF